jgi:hypothetical protein
VTFALLVDPNGAQLAGAIDINPEKCGQFMPGTGLPIVSPSLLKGGDSVIIMNSNYFSEIESQVGAMGVAAELMPIDSAGWPV